MRAREFINEGIQHLDPDVFEEVPPSTIARIAKRVVPSIRARSTPEGYVVLRTDDGLYLVIGCSIAGGDISVNLNSAGESISSGPHKGAVTAIIKAVYDSAVKKYGQPAQPGSLSVNHDAGHGVWQHIASKLGLNIETNMVKEDWTSVNKKDKTDGMSKKAVAAYRRENPGSKLKTAVTTKPSKLKKGSKDSKRRSSYCARSAGQKKMHSIDCTKTPDKAICKARKRWNC